MISVRGFWNKFDIFSPPLVRLLAAHRVRGSAKAMTDEEIAERSGLSVSHIQKIYWSKTWDGIAFSDIKAFIMGCGVNFDDKQRMKTVSNGLRAGHKMAHLRRSPNHKLFAQLIRLLAE